MQFFAGRISLIPIKESFFYREEKEKEKKLDLLERTLMKHFEYKGYRGTEIIHEPIISSSNKLVGGMIGKQSSAKMPNSR